MRTVKHLVHEVCESVSETEKRKMFPDKGSFSAILRKLETLKNFRMGIPIRKMMIDLDGQ